MIFKGTATALITPFKGGEVDIDAYERLLDFQLDGGVDAVVALGTTGEPATLTSEERALIISRTVKKLKGKLKIIVGCGSNCTRVAAEECKRAEDMGADAALIVTPYYNKCTQQGLFEHYRAICEATALPVICYNVPSRTGVNMLPSTFGRLFREVKGIVGIKEASGNIQQIAKCVGEAGYGAVYSGDDGMTVPVMALGGVGVISVASNIFPTQVSKMTSLCLSGDFTSAAKLQLELMPAVDALFSEVNPIPVKYAASRLGFGDGSVRLPLTPLEPAHKKFVDDLLHAVFAVSERYRGASGIDNSTQ